MTYGCLRSQPKLILQDQADLHMCSTGLKALCCHRDGKGIQSRPVDMIEQAGTVALHVPNGVKDACQAALLVSASNLLNRSPCR